MNDINAWQDSTFSIQSISLGQSSMLAGPHGVPGLLTGTITSISASPAGVSAAVPESNSIYLFALGLLTLGMSIYARKRRSIVS
jgi:hypothetical protein